MSNGELQGCLYMSCHPTKNKIIKKTSHYPKHVVLKNVIQVGVCMHYQVNRDYVVINNASLASVPLVSDERF